MPDIQVTQDPAAVVGIVVLIGLAAVIGLIFGTGVLSRTPKRPQAPSSPPPSPPAHVVGPSEPTETPRAFPYNPEPPTSQTSTIRARVSAFVAGAMLSVALVLARYVFSHARRD